MPLIRVVASVVRTLGQVYAGCAALSWASRTAAAAQRTGDGYVVPVSRELGRVRGARSRTPTEGAGAPRCARAEELTPRRPPALPATRRY
ncbi:hypothetical protein ACFOSC_21950 [Streptantibioticus rubrisoli]|uniref:Secreted protein n=1 Tax=Streptantibioticus rubrisoli TaxID=1387313 RepID=A0ABT1P5J8_9ACTN|nr:hypothetical protein [Streptantibioticus rubrisoli]MCQ4040622.1 hypothetical protein [Streptantibioticus rubrisoli]